MVSDLSEGHPNCQKQKIEIDQVVSGPQCRSSTLLLGQNLETSLVLY